MQAERRTASTGILVLHSGGSWAEVSSSETGCRSAMQASPPPRTFISDLRPSRVATIEATVTKLDPIREVEQRLGGTTRVRNVLLNDGTGDIVLVLWGKDVELVAEGEKVRVVDGWVKDYRGKPEISLGRRGRIEKT